MPRRQPFTQLCRLAAQVSGPGIADLHTHTTASDGEFTPSQVILRAHQAQLKAVAITDHDTIAGWSEAEEAIRVNRLKLEFRRGVELTTHFESHGFHLLAYDFQLTDEAEDALNQLAQLRRSRFQEYLDQLGNNGIVFADGIVAGIQNRSLSLGRRHLATLILETGIVKSRYAAFRDYLHPLRDKVAPFLGIPLEEAIAIIHRAGGWCSLAHPSSDFTFEHLKSMTLIGLDAVEIAFPAASRARTIQLREWAQRLNLLVTSGSDSHGTERPVGSVRLSAADYRRIDPINGFNGGAVQAEAIGYSLLTG